MVGKDRTAKTAVLAVLRYRSRGMRPWPQSQKLVPWSQLTKQSYMHRCLISDGRIRYLHSVAATIQNFTWFVDEKLFTVLNSKEHVYALVAACTL